MNSRWLAVQGAVLRVSGRSVWMLLVLVGVFSHVLIVHAQLKMPKDRIPADVPAEVRAQIERLYSADPAEREAAAAELGSMGQKAVAAIPFLVGMLGDGSEVVRPRPPHRPGVVAAKSLVKIGAKVVGTHAM